MSATNILYLTSRCNFDCEYCYEHRDNRELKLFDLTEEEALKNIDEIMEREASLPQQTMIVLFGGEPTLNWDVCKKAARYAYSIKKNTYFCLSTNGWKFRHDEFCRDFLKLARDVNQQIGVDFSFDGVGNFRRKLVGGASTTEGMYLAIKNLHRYNIRYSMRYTVHEGNVDLAAEDIVNMDKFFNPVKYVVSYDSINIGLAAVDAVKTKLRRYYKDGLITKPICSDVCDLCQKCDTNRPISYWSQGNIRNVAVDTSVGDFKDF